MLSWKRWIPVIAALLTTMPLVGANLDDTSLSGDYFARQLELALDESSEIIAVRSLLGTFTFDGSGNYTFRGLRITGDSAGEDHNTAGSYSVAVNGVVSLTNPLRNEVTLNARLGTNILLGSTTELGGVADLLVAIPASEPEVDAGHLTGTFQVAGLGYSAGLSTLARNQSFQLVANGAGGIADFEVRGMAANLGGRPLNQTVVGAAYTLGSRGEGTIDFPDGGEPADSRLIVGLKALYVSADGGLILIGSTTPAHDILVGIRAMPGGVTDDDWQGLYWGAGLRSGNSDTSSFAGAQNATGAGKLVWSKRMRTGSGSLDFTGVNAYSLAADGTGTAELGTAALGLGGKAFVGTGISVISPGNYELYLGMQAESPAGEGVFLHPNGVVNAASFAPVGNPVAPGEFVTLFGTNLAPATDIAASLPFPVVLQGVRVLVNDTPAPVYVVSATQVSFLTPHSLQGPAARIVVDNNGESSNAVEVRLAPASPGIFTVPPGGIGDGAILKADWSVVNAGNPVRPGDAIQVFLTGLGAVSPPVPDGAAARADPLSWVTADVKVYIGGREAQVIFKGLAPNFAGLYQLNVLVPDGVPVGDAIPLAVETPGAFHDQVDIAVSP
jgi:uncharacterized protein (TIGR03437 family)